MARKPAKKKMEAAIVQYDEWRKSIDGRLAAVMPAGQAIIRAWADDVGERVKAGEWGACTTALARSVCRAIKDFESGYYVGVTESGGFKVTTGGS